MPSFSDRDDREIDEYHDKSNSSEDSSSSESSFDSSSSDEVYSSRTPGIPFEVFYEKMRKRALLGSFDGPSTTPPAPIPSPV